METAVQLIISGLALGLLYALVALGFSIIYRASQVFNFAQGELVALGAFIMIQSVDLGMPWVVALLFTMAATGIAAALIERVILRRLVGRPVYVTIILTIVLGYVLRTIIIIIWGADTQGMPTPWPSMSSVALGSTNILYNSVGALVAGAVALGGFFFLTRYSRLGLGMRACSIDQEAALSLGIPVGRILGATWFLAGVSAALAGVFLGMFPRSVDANLAAMRTYRTMLQNVLQNMGR